EVVRGRASRAERVTQLLLAAGGRALATAGFDAAAAAETRAGIVVGTAFGCFLTNAAYQRRVAAGGQTAASPRLFAATVSNAAAGELAIAYRLAGPAVTVTAGGASGLTALGEAMEAIRAGRADVVVAAGVDATGEALAEWLAATGGAYGAPPAEAGAAGVLERARRRARRAPAAAVDPEARLRRDVRCRRGPRPPGGGCRGRTRRPRARARRLSDRTRRGARRVGPGGAVSLAGRRALVTGGTRGIGLATARALAAEGARVAVSWSRSADDAAAALAALSAQGATAHAVRADVGDPAAVRRMFAEVGDALGGSPD